MSRRLLDRPEVVSHDIVARAIHRAGTDDFDGIARTEALDVLTKSLDREAGLTVSGRREARYDLGGQLVDRTRSWGNEGTEDVADRVVRLAVDDDCSALAASPRVAVADPIDDQLRVSGWRIIDVESSVAELHPVDGTERH